MALSYYANHSSPAPHTSSRAARTRTLAFVLAVLSLLNVGLVVKRHDRVDVGMQGGDATRSGQLWRSFSWRGLDYPEKLPLLTSDGEPSLAEMIVEETVHFNPLLPTRDQTWHVMRSLSNGYFRSPSPPDTLTPLQSPSRPLPQRAWNQSVIDPKHPDFDPLEALEGEEGGEGMLARGKNRMFITTMFHEVHCMRVFAAVLAGVAERGHLLHCTDYMRDGILCGADMTLEPEDWLVRSPPTHDRPTASSTTYEPTNGVPVLAGFESRPFTSPSYIYSRSSSPAARYTCRNWETAYGFLDGNFAGGGGWNETRYEWMVGDPGLKVKSAPGHHH